MTPDMSARFREVTDSLMARLREPLAKAQAVDQLLGQLLEVQQAMTATAGTLAEAAAAMQRASGPKRVELIRDERGRAAGAVVTAE
jgi:hypothetical protein